MRLKLLAIIFCMFFSFGIAVEATNYALLVGIGNYDKTRTGWKTIHGNNDVDLLLTKLVAQSYEVVPLKDKKATKANILRELRLLSSRVSDGDVVYLHFSGHGQIFEDVNHDETDGRDQSFVCYDACLDSNFKYKGKQYVGQNHLLDDELFPFINQLKNRVGKSGNVIVVFDSCYSDGSARNGSPEVADPDCDVDFTDTTRGTDEEFPADTNVKLYLQRIKKPANFSSTGGRLTIICACGSDKVNHECKAKHSGRKYGSLSYCISKLLDKNIPITQWGEYFSSGKYRNLKIIRQSQTPTVEIH